MRQWAASSDLKTLCGAMHDHWDRENWLIRLDIEACLYAKSLRQALRAFFLGYCLTSNGTLRRDLSETQRHGFEVSVQNLHGSPGLLVCIICRKPGKNWGSERKFEYRLSGERRGYFAWPRHRR